MDCFWPWSLVLVVVVIIIVLLVLPLLFLFTFLPFSFLQWFLYYSSVDWNQTYSKLVIWLFSCFKASPRCRAPSEPIWFHRKLRFVLFLKSKTINVSYPFIYLSRKSYRLSYYLVMYVVVPKRRMRKIEIYMDGWIDKYDDPGKFNKYHHHHHHHQTKKSKRNNEWMNDI